MKKLDYCDLVSIGINQKQLDVYCNSDPLEIYEIGENLYRVTGIVESETDAHGVCDLLQALADEETADEWLEFYWEHLQEIPAELYTLEAAKADLDHFRSEEWELPRDLTPELYMEYINERITEYAQYE